MNNYEPKSMQTFLPIIWKKAKKEIVWDINNKKYIDFSSTIFVMSVGHSNKRVKRYLKKQINNNLLHTYLFSHKSRSEFTKKLIEITPSFCEKVFLLSSGTEATEAAVKLMRMYNNKKIIISFKGSMHGRTMAADLMKGSNYHSDFVQLNFPKKFSSFLEDIEKLNINTKHICGFMIETYQGWSAKFLPLKYIKDLTNFARKNDILVCFDEVQAGFGRTGKLFGYQYYDVEPDLICVGKGIGGGLPLSGVLGRKKILDVPTEGEMSSTHSANPLCCIAGTAVLEEIERKKLILKSQVRGRYLEERLYRIKGNNSNIIKEINCKGLIAGIIFYDKEVANNICRRSLNKGLLLVHTGRESIKIGPPLVISKRKLREGLDILEEVIYDYRN